ncbi:MAG: CtpF protein, partial [Methyloceanibacter sp.]
MGSDAAFSFDLTPESGAPLAGEPSLSADMPRPRPVPRVHIRAFCEDQATAALIQLACEHRRLAKAHVTLRMGGVQAAIAFHGDGSTPN